MAILPALNGLFEVKHQKEGKRESESEREREITAMLYNGHKPTSQLYVYVFSQGLGV